LLEKQNSVKGITMISNCFRQLVFNALVVCVVSASLVKADDAVEKSDTDSASVEAAIVDQADDGFVVELTITGKTLRGVPLLRNVPYVSRLFKNTGVAQVKKTIFVPSGESQAIVDFDTLQAQITTDSVDDTVEFIPVDWDNELIQCDFAVPVSKPKAKAKPKKPNGKCKGASCDCKKAKETSVKKLQKQLFAIAVENAELRARAETQKEIAQLKERLLQASAEAKIQIARFQAHTAFTNFARSRQQQHAPQHAQQHAPQHVQLRAPHYNTKHHNPVVEQLKQENSALRKLVAELELKERGQSKR
jgi:hypothetical protein